MMRGLCRNRTWRQDVHECPICQIRDGSGCISAGKIQKPDFVKGIKMEQLTEYIVTAVDEGLQEGTEPTQPETDSPEEELEEDELDDDEEDETEEEEELESESTESAPGEQY